MTRTLMQIIVCVVLSIPAVAQSDDAAYCDQFGTLALRYTGSAGGEGRASHRTSQRSELSMIATRATPASGIAVLEKKLQGHGFTLPKR